MKKSDLLKLKSENISNSVIKNLINTIIGDLDRISKDPSEEQVNKVIKKMYEDNREVTQTDDIIKEQEFLRNLLPRPLTPLEIKDEVNKLNFTKIGDYMSYFKNNFPSRYDGKELSAIVREKLQ